MEMITVYCKPVRVRIGDYFPAEFEMVDVKVAVNVPLTPELVENYDTLAEGVQDTPRLTIAGFRWCYNQLRNALVDPESDDPDKDADTDLDDEEWK
jgi:hypothetical protein